MRPELLDRLVCPPCGDQLELDAFERDDGECVVEDLRDWLSPRYAWRHV